MKITKLPALFICFFGMAVTGSVAADSYPKEMHGTWTKRQVTNCKKDMETGSGNGEMQTVDKKFRDMNIYGQCTASKVKGKNGSYTINEKCFESGDGWKMVAKYTVEGDVLTIHSLKNTTKEKYKKCTDM